MKTIYSLFVLIAIVAGTLYFKGCFAKKENAPITQYVNPLVDTVKHYKDLYGTEHAQIQAEFNTHEAIDAMHKQMIDSLLKRIHLKDKQLQDMSEVTALASGSFDAPLQPIIIHDTVNGIPEAITATSFEWHDDYLSETGTVYDNHISVEYSMNLTFTTTSYWKHKHHFLNIGWGKKIYYLDASCPNQNVSITGLRAIKIN